MAGQEVGVVYVHVEPSAKGFSSSLSKEFAAATPNINKASSGWGSGISSGLSKAWGIAKTAAIGAVGGMAAAVTGLAAKGGFDRALNIERAQTKLKALGHDSSSIQSIMDDALASVKGTAFGLGDAASVAAMMVASGVKSGGELKGVLTTIGDTAQVAGVEFKDMGTIFSKVAATGHLQGDEMNQLMEAGIPILQNLADHYGVTAEEVRDMVSDGKVSFADFEAAMQESLGGAAQRAGESFDGAMANCKAALSRLGEKAWTPILKGMTGFFNAAIPMIDGLTSSLGPGIERMGEAIGNGLQAALPKVQQFGAWCSTTFSGISHAASNSWQAIADSVAPALNSVKNTFSLIGRAISDALGTSIGSAADGIGVKIQSAVVNTVAPAFGRIATVGADAFRGLVTGVQPFIANIGNMFNTLKGVVGTFWDAFKSSGGSVGALKDLWNALSPLISPFGLFKSLSGEISNVLKQLAPVLAQVAASLGQQLGAMLPSITSMLQSITPILGQLVQAAGQIMSAILPVIGNLLAQLAPVLTVIINAVSSLAQSLAGTLSAVLPSIVSIIQTLAQILSGTIMAVMPAIVSALQALMPVLTTVMDAVGQIAQAILPVVADLLQMLAPYIVQVAGYVGQLIKAIAPLIAQLLNTLIPVITQVIETVMSVVSAIMPIVQPVLDAVMAGIQFLLPVIQGILTVVTDVFSGINVALKWLMEAVQRVVDFIRPVIEAICAFISGAIQALSEVWMTIWNGICTVLGTVWNTMKTIVTTVATAIHDCISHKLDAIQSIWNAIWGGIKTVVETVWNGIKSFVTATINGVKTVITSVLNAIKSTWDNIWNGIKSFFVGIWNGIKGTTDSATSGVRNTIANVLNAIKATWNTVWNGIKTVASNVWNGIKSVVNGAINGVKSVISSVLNGIKGIWNNMWNGIKSGIGAIWNGIKSGVSNGINSCMNTVRSIKGNITGFFAGAGSWLVASGRSILNGLRDGIMSGINSVKNAVSGALQSIRNLFPFSPAKEGPFSGHGWVLYSGRSIMDAMAQGIGQSAGDAVDAAHDAADEIHSALALSVPSINMGALDGQVKALSGGLALSAAAQLDTENTTEQQTQDDILATLQSLLGELPDIIANYTPTVGKRDLSRMVGVV